MSEKFSNLKQFLGGYFHQDWPLEADSGDQVLHHYANQVSIDTRLAVAQEIAELLSKSDDIINATVRRFGSCYDPSIEGLNMRQWLNKVMKVLQAK